MLEQIQSGELYVKRRAKNKMGKSKIVETHMHVYRAMKRMSQDELAKKIGVDKCQ